MTAVRLNDIAIPPGLLKGMDLNTLKSINDQNEVTFYEFFQGLNLPNVRSGHSSDSERYIN